LARLPVRLTVALVVGLIAFGYYVGWWLAIEHGPSPWLLLLLTPALVFFATQFLGSWLLYLAASRYRRAAEQPPALRIDVFLTCCGEPLDLIEPALRAALALHTEHRTFLLDDGRDVACAQLCERLGAEYFTRLDNANAKAGNLNAALARTDGDVVVIFDSDHIPQPDFLTRTLHHFADPAVGFVQVMLSSSNQNQSWIAGAAAETSLDFYNPTSLGMDALRSATLMGSNALIRRTALEGIGGYQLGLAEDLATSLLLHMAGWRSAYVAEPLAPGLAPATLLAWYTQQLKWARGVFEVLLALMPRAFARLDWSQRLAYMVRTTKYWIGPVVLLHLTLTSGAVLLARAPTQALVRGYLLQLVPLVISDLWIRREALRLWRHPSVSHSVPLRALMLVYFSWPIYCLAWVMAVLRLPLGFQPTPKSATGRLRPVFLLPQFAASVVLLLALIVALSGQRGTPDPVLLLTVAGQLTLPVWLVLSRVAWQITHRGRQPANDALALNPLVDV
jgi:cellulose synthase (UDP-forming)